MPTALGSAVLARHRALPIIGDNTMKCFLTCASSARSAMLAILLAGVLLPASVLAAEQPVPIAELAKQTHFHGIAAHPDPTGGIHLATHHGLFRVDGRGLATRVAASADDFMGFTVHPTRPEVLYASGHPARGGNLGIITSTDSGRTWRQLSRGLNGPVDFHQLAVSKADPNVIYGAFRGLQISRDGGESWGVAAPGPDGLMSLAASSVDTARLYAATKGGLLYSTDAGKTWQPAHLRRSAATMVYTGYDNDVYAFMIGVGLVRTREPALRWELVNDRFGEHYLLHLAVDPAAPQHLYAITSAPAVIASRDGGARWAPLGATVAD
jgi:photosystem II stability/assembly factor-like uncharacterized protein